MIQLASQERAAKIAWFLARGIYLTNGQICAWTGLSRQGVAAMMTKLARVLPIVKVEGVWSASEASSDVS